MLWPPLQDEPSTLQLLKKHLVLEQTIEDYAETIGLLSQQCRQLLEMGHPDRSVLVPHKPFTTLHHTGTFVGSKVGYSSCKVSVP